jgi:hypothetical protein
MGTSSLIIIVASVTDQRRRYEDCRQASLVLPPDAAGGEGIVGPL